MLKKKRIYYVPVIYEMSGKIPVEAESPEKAYDIIRNNRGTAPLPVNPQYVGGSLIPARDMPADEDEGIYGLLHNMYSHIYADEPIFKPAKKNRKQS